MFWWENQNHEGGQVFKKYLKLVCLHHIKKTVIKPGLILRNKKQNIVNSVNQLLETWISF